MKSRYSYILILNFIAASFMSCSNEQGNKSGKETTINEHKIIQDSLEFLSRLINENPDQISTLLVRANYHYDHKNYHEAATDIMNYLSKDTNNVNVYYLSSQISLQLNQFKKVKSNLEKCIQMDSLYDKAYIKLGELYFYSKKYQSAFNYINAGLMINKFNYVGYFYKGLIYSEIKDTSKAISNLQTAIELNPSFYQGYTKLGQLHYHKDLNIALQYYNSAVNLDDTKTEALYARALCYHQDGNYEKALNDYSRITKLDPKHADAYHNKGYVYYMLDSISHALSYYDTAISIDPDYAEAYYNRGLCYEALNNQHNALDDYIMSLSLKPDFQLAIQKIKANTR